jgi:hypothetical protein
MKKISRRTLFAAGAGWLAFSDLLPLGNKGKVHALEYKPPANYPYGENENRQTLLENSQTPFLLLSEGEVGKAMHPNPPSFCSSIKKIPDLLIQSFFSLL